MKKLNGEEIFSLMSNLDPRLVSEAVPPSWVSDSGAMPRKVKRRPFSFLDSGWAAAILSVVVALGVLSAIIIAGRMNPGDSGEPPPGANTASPLPSDSDVTRETDSEAGESAITETEEPITTETETEIETGDRYVLAYTSNGDGTGMVEIIPNGDANEPYDVIVPKAGYSLELLNTFNAHLLAPSVMTANCFKQYIQAPLEAYYGLTAAEAKAIKNDPKHPLSEQGFLLRKNLALYLFRTQDMMVSEADTHPEWSIETDYYLLEPTLSTEERRELHDLLVAIGFTAEQWETANRELLAHTGDAAQPYIPLDIHLSAGIRTLTLPTNMTRVPANMFDEWINLEKIVYEGSAAEWLNLTAGKWNFPVPVICSDDIVRPVLIPDIEPVINERTFAVVLPEKTTYVAGIQVYENILVYGEWQETFTTYPLLEKILCGPLSGMILPAGTTPDIRYYERDDWEYEFNILVYDAQLNQIMKDGTDAEQREVSLDALATLPTGIYYVQLCLRGVGLDMYEDDKYEGDECIYTFRLEVTELNHETESETPAETMQPVIDGTTMAVYPDNVNPVYVKGEPHWTEFLHNGQPMSGDMEYSTLEQWAASPNLITIDAPTWTVPTMMYQMTDGWSYGVSVVIYDRETLTKVKSGPVDIFYDLPVGEYIVEFGILATGPVLPDTNFREANYICYTFGWSVGAVPPPPDTPGDVLAEVPPASAYVGEMRNFEEIYTRYPAYADAVFRWRIEKRRTNGLFIEELACPDETFTLTGNDTFRPPFDVMRDPDYHYYVHFIIYENGAWRTVGYVVLEVAIEAGG